MHSKKNDLHTSFLTKTVFNFLEKLDLNHQTVVIGLSGGPDSIALLHLLNQHQAQFNYQLIAAHLDHEWREQSNLDLIFCQELCAQLKVKFIGEKASNLNLNIKNNGSKEELGRILRKSFLESCAKKYQARYIFLGHHLDDQIETFFIRLIRGSSPSGLGGMQVISKSYCRPFLSTSKTELLDYLKEHNYKYLQDSTNDSDLFLRNKLRKLIPLISQADDRFKPNFNNTIHKIQDHNDFMERLIQNSLNQVSQNEILDLRIFKKLDPFLQKKVLIAWLYQNQVQFTQTDKFVLEISRFLNSPNGGTHQIRNWQIYKKQHLAKIIKF
jgi:tRNA(Ile)-lysidine synthase